MFRHDLPDSQKYGTPFRAAFTSVTDLDQHVGAKLSPEVILN
jgi:hypothetical protein